MKNKTVILTLIVLSGFLLASISSLLSAQKITSRHEASAKKPDFFMSNVTIVRLDQDGKIHNQTSTSKITHLMADDAYFFTAPHIKIFNANEEPWDISATNGKSDHGKEKVYLWDNVKITQNPGLNNTDFNISTNALTVFPDSKLADTDQPVTIIQGNSIASAIGAHADFNAGTVKLLAKVVGQYQTK